MLFFHYKVKSQKFDFKMTKRKWDNYSHCSFYCLFQIFWAF